MKLDNSSLNIIKYIGESGDYECGKINKNSSDLYTYFIIQFMLIGLGVFIYSNSDKLELLFINLFSFLMILLNIFLIYSVKKSLEENPILINKSKIIFLKLFKNIKKDNDTIIALKTLNNELFNIGIIKFVNGKRETNLTLKEYRKLLKDKIKYIKNLKEEFKK